VGVWDVGTGKHLRALTMPERDCHGGTKYGKYHKAMFVIAVPRKKGVLVVGEEAFLLTPTTSSSR